MSEQHVGFVLAAVSEYKGPEHLGIRSMHCASCAKVVFTGDALSILLS